MHSFWMRIKTQRLWPWKNLPSPTQWHYQVGWDVALWSAPMAGVCQWYESGGRARLIPRGIPGGFLKPGLGSVRFIHSGNAARPSNIRLRVEPEHKPRFEKCPRIEPNAYVKPSGPNFIELLSTKTCLAWNFFLDKNMIPTKFPFVAYFLLLVFSCWFLQTENHLEDWLVILFFARAESSCSANFLRVHSTGS